MLESNNIKLLFILFFLLELNINLYVTITVLLSSKFTYIDEFDVSHSLCVFYIVYSSGPHATSNP